MTEGSVQIHGSENIDQVGTRGVVFMPEVSPGQEEAAQPLVMGAELMAFLQGYVRVRGNHVLAVEPDDLETEGGTVGTGRLVLLKRWMGLPSC